MLTEFRVRQELDTIERSPEPPLRRARKILRIAKSIEAGCVDLMRLSRWHLSTGDTATAVRFLDASRKLSKLGADARRRAAIALQGRRSLRYEVSPTRAAVPGWDHTKAPTPALAGE